MSNVRFYPDEGIKNFRFEDDIEYLVVSEKNWEEGVIYGFSSTSYGVACQYAYQHSNTNWVICCIQEI